ncbi:hypothetical protein [Bacillus spizizenii]|uniref:hypothetical protein n=1 Tax=Bacillus spizizenii TaxID=96241 RepID=UPI000AAC25B0
MEISFEALREEECACRKPLARRSAFSALLSLGQPAEAEIASAPMVIVVSWIVQT